MDIVKTVVELKKRAEEHPLFPLESKGIHPRHMAYLKMQNGSIICIIFTKTNLVLKDVYHLSINKNFLVEMNGKKVKTEFLVPDSILELINNHFFVESIKIPELFGFESKQFIGTLK